jgi:isopentenyl-diphosphate Delta-isomerase
VPSAVATQGAAAANEFEIADSVQLLCDDGTAGGVIDKIAAHESPGRLHRAFSVLLFDEAGRLLLQRRADSKYHFAGKWSNACCSHPPVGADVVAYAENRLLFELGLKTALEVVGSFRYVAVDPETSLVEREDDIVLVGYVPGDVVALPNPSEVSATKFLRVEEVCGTLTDLAVFTPWLAGALECAASAGHPRRV